ncbi:MAG: hypothetical protein ACRC63_01560, partial [Metamycoplasmataceae bacterium]
ENQAIIESKEFLVKLFNLGDLTQLEIDQMLNVTLETITDGMEYKVILSPKNIYITINGQNNSFESEIFTLHVRDIVVSKTANLPNDITLADVQNQTIIESKEFLVKLFNLGDLTQLEIDQMLNVTLETITDEMEYKVILNPKNIYITINGQNNPFESEIFTLHVRDVIISKAADVPSNITLSDLEDQMTIKSQEFLNKLFNFGDLTQTEIDQMLNVTFEAITVNVEYKVILRPKNIYVTINGQSNSFESEIFIIIAPFNLEIGIISSVVEDMTTIDISPVNIESLETLSKLFVFDESFDQIMINKAFTITLNENTWDGKPANSITLIRRPGYTINGLTSITSSIFRVQMILSNVTVIQSPVLKLNTTDVSAHLLSTKTLQNFFTLTDEQVYDNVIAILNGDIFSGNPLTITLRANDGSIFPDGKEITSVEFTVDIMIYFTPRVIPGFNLNVNNLTNNLLSDLVMKSLFTGYSVQNLNNITARVNGEIRVGNSVSVT